MKHLFDLKAYNLSIVSYGKQKLYWFSRVFYLLCNEKLKITSACLDLSLDMEGPAGNSAGHIDSLGFFFYLCNYLFPRRDLEQLQGMTAQHWQVTVSAPTPQTTATHPPWWQEWDYDAPEMQHSTKEHLSGKMEREHDPSLTTHWDGPATPLSEYVTIMTDCLNISCVLYRHAKRKILVLNCMLSCAIQLPHRQPELNCLLTSLSTCVEKWTTCLPDQGKNMGEPVPAHPPNTTRENSTSQVK